MLSVYLQSLILHTSFAFNASEAFLAQFCGASFVCFASAS